MTNAAFQISVGDSDIKRLFNKLASLAGRKLRDNFTALKPLIKETMDEEVEKDKRRFTPTQADVAELGIGDGGSESEKASNGWKGLLSSSPAITISTTKVARERSAIIGQIKITIDEDKFFALPDSIIATPKAKIKSIPWMEWLIDGAEVDGFSFTNRVPEGSRAVSRTGKGIMVKGGFWNFSGRGRESFDKTLNKIRISINNELKANRGVKILRKSR